MNTTTIRGIVCDTGSDSHYVDVTIRDKSDRLWRCTNLNVVSDPESLNGCFNGWEFDGNVRYKEKTGEEVSRRMRVMIINPRELWNPTHMKPSAYKGLEGVILYPSNAI